MKYLRSLLIPVLFFLTVRQSEGSGVAQEIIYRCPAAGEVYFVWGINNWSLPSEKAFPENSYVKNSLVYSPMKKNGETFSININLSSGTTLDYVFMISRDINSLPVEIWDDNKKEGQKDYHTVVGKQERVEIISAVKPGEKQKATLKSRNGLLDSGLKLCLYAAFVLLFYFVLRYKPGVTADPVNPYLNCILQGILLSIFLFFIRAAIIGADWNSAEEFFGLLPFLIAGFASDLSLVLVYLGIILGVIFLSGKTVLRKYIPALSLFLTLCILSYCLVSIKTIQLLGRPLNYQWLYYSDFLGSSDAKNAIVSNLNDALIHNSLGVLLSFLISWSILASLMLRFGRRTKICIASGLFVSLALLLGYSFYRGKAIDIPQARMENPLSSFLRSVSPFSSEPDLFTMKTGETFGPEICACRETCSLPPGEIKNILVYVLESTPAEYLEPYGGKYPVTPVLKSVMDRSWIFDNIYAHAPATNKSLVTMLCSLYPWLSYNSISQEHPDIRAVSLSEMLNTEGYRCGFFNAGDNRFQNAEEFLKNRRFNTIMDYRDLPKNRTFTVDDKTWANLDGADDEALHESLASWVEKDPAKPFFAMLWTYQTHYPYFVCGEKKNYEPGNEDLNRYLNALNHSDMVLGRLLAMLKEKKLDRSTLVIVLGDHGEAFGRHNQTTHASGIYEENVHIPLIMIHPSFEGKRFRQLGGLVDIAPTVASVLNKPLEENWQGKSLFDKHRTDRVYFFAPWSEYLFGYREGNMKFIYNAGLNASEIYDLEKDPFEEVNLAGQLQNEVKQNTKKLAAWVQYQDKFIKRLLNNKNTTSISYGK